MTSARNRAVRAAAVSLSLFYFGVASVQRAFAQDPVDPNRQLGGQVYLPIMDYAGQDDVCRTMIEVQLLGCEPSKAVLLTWGEPGFCPPQAAGPLKAECTGLLRPGTSWMIMGAQIPTGSKGGTLFKFTARSLSEIGIQVGYDEPAADLMCETLFFSVVGDADDYHRFVRAYRGGGTFEGIDLFAAGGRGRGSLAVEVLRRCPGDLTPGVDVSSKYSGVSSAQLGSFDPVFGGYAYYVPLVYANRNGLNTVVYVQNGGLECSSLELWFKGQDDCLRSRICDVGTVAPGETYQFDASDCVGPAWEGSAWIRSAEPLAVAVDIYGRDVLMTYTGVPAPFDHTDAGGAASPSTGEQVAYGPLIYSEFQGWDSGVQVMNLGESSAAKIKVYFLDRSGDVITTLVDWICPRGSQTFFLPLVADLPGSWLGSVRVESQPEWHPGTSPVDPPNIAAIATLMKYGDAVRTETQQAVAYNLLPEHQSYAWQAGSRGGGLHSGVGLVAIPSLLKDLDGTGVSSELAIMNLVAKPGFTDLAVYVYDQNGLLDFICQKLFDRQAEYIDLQAWGYLANGFKGSAVLSATFWEHEVFDPDGRFVRNLVGLGAVGLERSNARLGEDLPGDEAAGERGIPFAAELLGFDWCPGGTTPLCPGQPVQPTQEAHQRGYSFELLASIPDPAPGSPGLYLVNDFEIESLNDSGEVMWGADVSPVQLPVTPAAGEGYWLSKPGGSHRLVTRSDLFDPEGVQFSRSGFMGPGDSNNPGDAGFGWRLLPAPPPAADSRLNSGLYRLNGQTLSLTTLFKTGQPAPPPVNIWQGVSSAINLNNSGDLLFHGIYLTSSGTYTFNALRYGVGLFHASPTNVITPIVLPGDAAPSGGSFNNIRNSWINEAGDIAFGGHTDLDPTCAVLACPESIYLKLNGQPIVSIAHAGDVAPIAPLGSWTYQYAFGPRINKNKDVLFVGQVTNNVTNGRGVFLYRGGKVLPIAWPTGTFRVGNQGYIGLNTANFVHNVFLNDLGQVVFTLQYDANANGDDRLDQGVFLWEDGRYYKVVQSGDDIPGIGTVSDISQPNLYLTLVQPRGRSLINNKGQIAFSVRTTDGQGRLILATPR